MMIKPAMHRLLSALLVALALVLGLGPAPAHTHTVLERRVPSICAERRPDAELPASPASHRPRRSLPPTTAGASTDKEGTDGRAAARSAASTWQGRQHRGAREYDPGKSPTGDDPGKSPTGDDPGKSPTGDDPEVGRWVTKDPVLFTGGVNLYAYAENDPVNWIDPAGLWVLQAGGAVIGGPAAAFANWNAHESGQMSGAEFGTAIAFGAGTGALATLPTSLIGGAIVGGAAAGANDVFGQVLGGRCIDFGQVGRATLFGFGAGLWRRSCGEDRYGALGGIVGDAVGTAGVTRWSD